MWNLSVDRFRFCLESFCIRPALLFLVFQHNASEEVSDAEDRWVQAPHMDSVMAAEIAAVMEGISKDLKAVVIETRQKS
jgi:hypothetical protein